MAGHRFRRLFRIRIPYPGPKSKNQTEHQENSMASITLKGNECHTCGDLPAVGSTAPEFKLIGNDLSESTIASFDGRNVVLNIFPSLDTPVCATSVRQFNQKAAATGNTAVVNVSMDLPFAHKRFCESEGIDNVTNLSAFRSPEFGQDYGVLITDGPLQGLFARAIVVINDRNEVVHTQLIPEIAQEPDYDAALAAISQTA
jgi:thiol peroxidase